MFLSCWLTSVRNLFAARRLRGIRRPMRRWRQADAQQHLEQLEARQVMAFDFVSASAHVGAFITEGSVERESPQQITLTFSPGSKVDPQSIATGITVIRGGNGVIGDADDSIVVPGSITVDDLPNQNSVLIRFADTLPDDAYRIRITGAGTGGLKTLSQGTGLPSEPFRDGSTFELNFRLDLGAQVMSIVPQPVARPKLITFGTDMTQYRDGDLLQVTIRGARMNFEFDTNGRVSAGNRAVTLAGKSATDLATEIGGAITSSGVFGGELGAATVNGARVNVRGSVFTPVVAFTRGASVPAISPITVGDGAALVQSADKVVVYFNANDPLTQSSAQNPRNYGLVETDPVSGADVSLQVPMSVSYDATSGTSVLTFESGKVAADKLYRLQVGNSTDENNLLSKAVNVGSLFTGNGYSIRSFLGDGTELADDVDLYRASLTAAGTIAVEITPDAALAPLVRLFDSSGVEVAASTVAAAGTARTVSFAAPGPGVFYVGISSAGNAAYNPSTGAGAAGGTTRGGYKLDIRSTVAVTVSDNNSSFSTATVLGSIGLAGQSVSAAIDVRPTVPTPAGNLAFPSQPGTTDEPGHRDIPVGIEDHGMPDSYVDPASGMTVFLYNFQDVYGTDPQGNTLLNAITEEQKQRTREIFTLFSLNGGIRFVETADQGLTVVTGDVRAVSPGIPPTAVGGICGGGLAVMNSTIDWGQSEYGGAWFSTAMHELGHAIGLGHAYDLPSVMGAGGSIGENILPYDYDYVHINVLYPQNGSDIDVYEFSLDTAGTFSAETIVARQGQAAKSTLDSVLTLYKDVAGVRTLVARNDDYYGRDSFVGLDLGAGKYFLAVTSTGNVAFNPEVRDSGYGGRSDGAYDLKLSFTPISDVANTIVDATGTAIDGDRDGKVGGAFNFWFNTASSTGTIWVDKAGVNTAASIVTGSPLVTVTSTADLVVGRQVVGTGIPVGATIASINSPTQFTLSRNATATNATAGLTFGTLSSPYRTIAAALAAVGPSTRIVRILGNTGNDASTTDDRPYVIGTALSGTALPDGATFNVPKGVTVMIDEGAALKLRAAVINVGSSSGLVSRAGAALQVLGTPTGRVKFTSYHDDTLGGDTDGVGPAVQGGQWGGIVLRRDSDSPTGKVFLNTISLASLKYGGGNVFVDSELQSFAPIHVESTRPTLAFNEISSSAGAAISADPDAFLDADGRYGPEVRGNRLLGNTINGLFIRIRTELGSPVDKLEVPARWKSTDIVYVIQENLILAGGAGGYLRNELTGNIEARAAGRLAIDAGVVVKSQGARIELERGSAQLIAEGTAEDRVIFTSLGDNRYGAGGTFDTNGNAPDVRSAGDWGGIIIQAGSRASIDHAYVAYGGGLTAIEGGFDRFNTFEVQHGQFRLANSRIEFNASGRSTGDRNARGTNDDSTVFIRAAQPVIVGNDFRDNSGATISVNANSMSERVTPDSGRSTGELDRFAQYDDNVGPLLRENRISTKINYTTDRQKGAFDIALDFAPGLSQAIKDAMIAAAFRWETVITGDLTSVRENNGNVIDDILIRVQPGLLGGDSDGTGGTLANAAPTAFRSATDRNRHLPYRAEVGIDMADATSSQLVTILTHEIGHALGFTNVSNLLNLISGVRYVGANALREYRNTFDATATSVPLEGGGGSGTAFAHWSEAEFGSELLTGFLNAGINPLTRLTVGAFQDMGYSVNYSAADDYLPRAGTAGYAAPISGVVVRGGQITVDSVWDDDQIVHVLRDEIVVDNYHTATSLRLESKAGSSLIIKLDGPNAGFTATGTAGDIDDRIGGSLQVIGAPGYPVVITSLYDDTVGASLDPLGRTVTDTNNDGRAWIDATATAPVAGSWRSLKFLPLSNDTNVAIVREAEKPFTSQVDINQVPDAAQVLGVIAPTFTTGTATTESVQNKASDDNRRDGFVVRGTIATDDPTDVDIYSFSGYAGSEVWIDIDKTSFALDAMVELLDASGAVLARSADSQTDTGSVAGEVVTNTAAGTTLTYQLARQNILPGTLAGTIYSGNTAVQTFTVSRAGVFTFTSIGAPARRVLSATLDRDTGAVAFVWSASMAAGATRIEAGYDYGNLSLATLGYTATGDHGAQPLRKDAYRGNDYFTTNPRDAGFRMVLPGVSGSLNTYFVRVRSQPNVAPDAPKASYEGALASSDVKVGATSGAYELRLRLQQRDQVPGSTVQFADIRFATTGIDIQGLPRNSLLTGTAGDTSFNSNLQRIESLDVGKLLQSDQNTISVAGALRSATDVRWYTFSVDYAGIQSIGGVNGGAKTWATVLDIDYADGFRGDLTMSVYDTAGNLIYVSRDSNVADDQPGAGQGNDFKDTSRGSVGKLDPFLGTVQLPAGSTPTTPTRYYVAITSNAQLPAAMDGTFRSGVTNALVRLEPVNSVQRVVEDHIGSTGYTSGGFDVKPTQGALINVGTAQQLSANVRAFSLADVVLFVSSSAGLFTGNALRGGLVTTLREGMSDIGDIDMRTDGRLFLASGSRDDANVARIREIDTGNGSDLSSVGDGIPNPAVPPGDGDWWKSFSDTVDAMAIQRTDDEFNLNVFTSIRDGGKSFLYWGRANGNAAQADNTPYSLRGEITGAGITGLTTGLQFRNNGSTLFGVSTGGQFYSVSRSGDATLLADFSADVGGFEGLATAPENLENGRYAGMFFAVTTSGRLVCIDVANRVLLENVFDTNSDGVPEAKVSNIVLAGAKGLAFSPLDINLWHPTTARGSDAGHGINAAPDNSRTGGDVKDGGASMYFGFERYVDGDNTYNRFNPNAVNGQYGVSGQGAFNWQQELTGNAEIGGNYNLPGGAQGSLVTNSFSLAGYGYTDKPTLYFNYFLDTQNAQGNRDSNTMRDSARVFISVDNGLTWEVIATNNGARSSLDDTNAELPNTITASSAAGTAANQSVQELFDSTGTWRQARVDLGAWAGKSNIQLRFDFATAGMMDAAARRTTPDETKTVAAAAGTTVTLDSVSGLRVGMVVTGPGITGSPTIQAITSATQVTLSSAVTLAAGDTVRFYDLANRLLNDIQGLANRDGNLSSPERGQRNAHEGFYIDDIIVGFTERGEMVTGSTGGQTSMVNVATPVGKTYGQQSLSGEYQLEIRRGTEYAVQLDSTSRDITILGTIDTNDRLVQAPSAPAKVLEVNLVDGIGGPLTQSGNGRIRFPSAAILGAAGLEAPAGDTFAILDSSSATAVTNNLLAWTIDLAGQPKATLEFQYLTLPAQSYRALPPTFTTPTIAGRKVLPSGDGVAISVDNGVTWRTIAALGNTQGEWSKVRLDLADAGVTFSATTVIGFFQAGQTQLTLAPGVDLRTAGGIALDDFRVTVDPPTTSIGSIGDSNHPRTQGQFVVANNMISDVSTYGISITAGARDAAGGLPNPGPVRNLAVLNNAGLIAGAVAVNNVIANPGKVGILFAGDVGKSGAPAAAVPFGRLINNTIWGGVSNGTGIEVRDNAAPTILNNLFANLSRGVTVDASSGGARTVIGASAYWDVDTAVSGATESSAISLSGNPFVNAEGGNFYLVAGSEAIDSSVNALQDRTEYVAVKNPLGIAASPVLAPDRDLFGQLRGDEPFQASAPGLGSNVFKDRGAVDRVDFVQPTIVIVHPIDGSPVTPIDRDDAADAVRLERADGVGITRMVLQLNDQGVGIDKSTVIASAFVVRRDGVLLVNGVDYLFRYLQNPNQVIFESISAFPLGTYTITATTRAATPTTAGLLIDRANNTLLPNKADGSTSFQIALADIPTAPQNVVGTRGDSSVALAWDPPKSVGGTPILDYIIQSSTDGGVTWTTFNDGISAATSATVTGLVNGTIYVFRVQARNAVNETTGIDDGIWSTVSDPVKPLAPAGAPTNLIANGGNASATLSWTAPTFLGGAPLTDYLVEVSTDGGATWRTFSHPASTATTITVNGLSNGVGHVFRVSGITEYGAGDPSTVSIVVVPMTFPDAPTGLTAKVGNGLIGLSWTAGFNGGSTVTSHVVNYRVTGTSVWSTFTPPAPVTGTSVDVTGLVNGTNYEFQVASTNAVGSSSFSNIASATPVAPASQPLSLVAVGGNAQVDLSWAAPASDGGSPVTDYQIQSSVDGGVNWSVVADAVSTATAFTVGGLVNGTTYTFRVAAITSYGLGAWSSPSSPVMPMTVPTAPTELAGVRGDSSVALTWKAPADNGGAAIVDCIVEYRLTTSATWSTFPHAPTAASAITVTGLTNGQSYEFRVKSVNAAGESPASNVAGPLVPMTTASAPLNLLGVFGDTKVTLSWGTPTSNGGGAITDYLVQYREAKVGAPWFTFPHTPSTATSIVVNGLTNGTAYFFRVAAVNPAGNGATALTTPITPMTIPGAPAGLVATPGNANVVLTWRAPQSDGGGAITNYIVEYKTTSPTAAWVRFPRVASNATTATVTPLVNGTFYTFRVTAVNPAGIGPTSVATDVVMPVTVPAVPLNVVAVAGDKLARLTWEKPVTDGGLPITDYVVEYRSTADVAWTTFADGTSTATAATVTGLTNGVTYVFRITARSSFGTGSPSAVSSPVVVMGLPGAPTGLVATAGVNADVQLRWTAPADTGGVALTDFVIEYRRTTDTAWTTHPDGVSTATTVVVSGLATGSSYVFRVSARNPLGAGVASAISNAAAVIAPPSAPTLLVAKAGDKQASLSWTAPAANGSAITDYVIEYRRSTDTGWTVFTDGVTAATSAVVTNLVNGTTYAFRITAKNAAGSSLPTEESNLVRPIGPAAGPTGLTGTPSRGTVTLRWNAPTDTGGEPITRYVIQYRVNRAGTAWVTARWPAGVSPTATTARISGFVTRFGHLFRVAAVTSLGQGAWSAEAGPINPFGAA